MARMANVCQPPAHEAGMPFGPQEASLSENSRPTVDEHPQKVKVSAIAPAEHDPAEGWMGMSVQWVVTRNTVGSERTVFGITTFPPDGRHDIHRHPNAEELEYLIQGEGIARVGDVDVRMKAGDVVLAKANEAHGFWNTSTTEPAVLLWTYAGAASLDEAGYVYEPDVAHGAHPESAERVGPP
jgi:quercetin dioxygenase-like cupin family protein